MSIIEKLRGRSIPFIVGICLVTLLMIWLLYERVDAGRSGSGSTWSPTDESDCDPHNDLCAEGCP